MVFHWGLRSLSTGDYLTSRYREPMKRQSPSADYNGKKFARTLAVFQSSSLVRFTMAPVGENNISDGETPSNIQARKE